MTALTPPSIRRTIAALIVGGLAAGLAFAASALFDFAAFGNFKRMTHSGDTRGQVALSALPTGPGTWGVGALAGLKGEIVLHDGRLLVSRGDDHRGAVSAPKPDDQAVLFAAARVVQWREVTLPGEMTQSRFEAFVVEQARAQGLDVEQPFPFLVEGRFPALVWHVVTGETGGAAGGHGSAQGGAHANKQSGMKVFEQPGAGGRLVAVYSGARLEGVVSHPGERFHVHYADPGLTRSGHVDLYAVAAGAVLRLPVR
jgi:alpha-acetolactate decarboxylase